MVTRQHLAMTAALAAALACAGGQSASGHDIYMELRSKQGLPCCGGDPKTGDCEPVTYSILPNGDALIVSKRYRARIRVAQARITWSAVPGSRDEAHWCGVPRKHYYGTGRNAPALMWPPDETDPDFVTLCAFIDPGGT
jgi:hypothetical protein